MPNSKFGEAKVWGFEDVSSEPSTFNFRGRAIYDNSASKIKVYDGTQYIVASGGGGGGAGATWTSPDGVGASEDELFGQKVFRFHDGYANELNLWILVPSGFAIGTQVNMDISFSADTVVTTQVKFQSSTVRVPPGESIGSITGPHLSTNGDTTLPGSANKLLQETLDLTDTNGQINAIDVEEGHLLKINLKRVLPAGTATAGDLIFIPSMTQVRFS